MNTKLVPPQNIDAERAVLGGVLIDNTALDEIPFLKPAAFYKPSHEHIFSAMLDLKEHSEPIDVISLSTRLEAIGRHASAGDLTELAEFGMPESIAYHRGRLSKPATGAGS